MDSKLDHNIFFYLTVIIIFILIDWLIKIRDIHGYS